MVARRKVAKVIEVLDLVTQHKLDQLRDDLLFINERIAELEGRIQQLNNPTSYHHQELASELATWMAHHRVFAMKIKELVGGNPEHERAMRAEEQRQQMRQRLVERYRKDCLERAEEHYRQGDYRQGSLVRLSALVDARRQAEHEVH